MNELQIFVNKQFGEIRTLMIDDEPWFVGKDVAKILGYSDTFGALKKHVDYEDKQNCQNDSFKSNRGLTVINESGLYSLILSSKLTSARQFKRWIISEVLPQIRKHGMYATDNLLNNPDLAIAAFQALKEERKQRIKLEQTIKYQQPLVDFAQTVQSTEDNILIRECSKLASNYIGIDIGEKALYQKLRDWRMILKHKNEPSKLAYKQGILIYVERAGHKYGRAYLSYTTKVTPKGQVYIINKLIDEYISKDLIS